MFIEIENEPLISENAAYINRIYGKGKGRILTREAQNLKNFIGWKIKEKYRSIKPDKSEFDIVIEIGFPNKIRRDLNNYVKLIFDALTGIIYCDDSQITSYSVRRVLIGKWYLKITWK